MTVSMMPTSSALQNCLFQVTHAAAAALPAIALYPKERMSCAGSAFHEAPFLVEAVCKTVAENPGLFPDVPIDPAAILQGQDRARLFLSLSASFERLARRAHDAYLFEQSHATSEVMAVVRYGRLQLASPYNKSDRHRRLSDALRPAELILASRSSVQGKKKEPRRRLGLFSSREFLPQLHAPRQKKSEIALGMVSPAPIPSEIEGASMPLPLSPTPDTDTGTISTRDIAQTATIKAARLQVADTASALHLSRTSPEERSSLGGTLSAPELSASQSLSRFLASRPDVGEAAGVLRDRYQRTVDADLALSRLNRVAGEVEATAAIGEMFLSARLTDHNDRIFLCTKSEKLPAEDRDALGTYLVSADLIYDRQLQLIEDRKARTLLRKDRQAAELAAIEDEAERLRRSERLLEKGRKTP